MSDRAERALEAHWRATGAEEDELAWITARVRGGERLDWASYQRLVELEPPAAADYLEAESRGVALRSARLRVAARYGHLPACELLARDPELRPPPGAEDSRSPELPFRSALCGVVRRCLATSEDEHAPQALAVYAAVERALQDGAVSWPQAGGALLALDQIDPNVQVACPKVIAALNGLLYVFQRPDQTAVLLQGGFGKEAFDAAFVAELLAPVFASER